MVRHRLGGLSRRDANWVAGLQQVRQGLGEIESAMVGLGKQTTTTEDDNLVTSNWFDPDSQPTASWT